VPDQVTLSESFLAEFAAWLIVAGCFGMPALTVWFGLRIRGRKLLPPQRQRAVPWGGLEVTIAFFFVIFIAPALTQLLLSGRKKVDHPAREESSPAERLTTPVEKQPARLIEQIIAFPIQIAGVLLLLRWLSHAELYQVGLSTRRWFRNLLLGSIGWLVLSPLVSGLNFLATNLYLSGGGKLEEHPLMLVTQGKLLVLIVAVVVAPVQEELLFRGVLQNWLERQSKGATAVAVAAFVFAIIFRADRIQIALSQHNWQVLVQQFYPALFVAVVAAGFLAFEGVRRRWLPPVKSSRAIYFTALLFAAGHSAVWPSPIPLFVLGLGLGWLAYRTRSLVAPIVMHALLNLVACIVLIAVPQSAEDGIKGSEQTSAAFEPSGVATSSRDPGSWKLRCTYAKAIVASNRGDTAEDVTSPTSLPSRESLPPRGTGLSPGIFTPMSDRLTWPRSRIRTMVSWPR
jgi:membrane protease YdiL (CAAX protease family)